MLSLLIIHTHKAIHILYLWNWFELFVKNRLIDILHVLTSHEQLCKYDSSVETGIYPFCTLNDLTHLIIIPSPSLPFLLFIISDSWTCEVDGWVGGGGSNMCPCYLFISCTWDPGRITDLLHPTDVCLQTKGRSAGSKLLNISLCC